MRFQADFISFDQLAIPALPGFTLATTAPAANLQFASGFATAAVIGTLVVLAVALLLQKRIKALETSLAAEKKKVSPPAQQIFVQSRAQGEREDREHVIADLHISKLRVELDLLNRQLANRHTDDDRIEASKEFHELMVEKTKLEIDSMRLHIAELRKRMDDFEV